MNKAFVILVSFYAVMLPIVILGTSLVTALLQPPPLETRLAGQPGAFAQYWAQAPALIGFDHGIKGLVLLGFGVIPYYLWRRAGKDASPSSHIGLAAGAFYGVVSGLSFLLQGITITFAARGVGASPELAAVYGVLGDWAMPGGGLSFGFYTIAHILLAVWLLGHSGLVAQLHRGPLARAGLPLAAGVLGATLCTWAFLLLGNDTSLAHLVQQGFTLLVQIWVAALAVGWLRSRRSSVTPRSLGTVPAGS